MSRNTKPSKKPGSSEVNIAPTGATRRVAPTTRQDQKSLTLGEIARKLGGKVVGNKGIFIRGVMTIDEAREGDITFIANEKNSKKKRGKEKALPLQHLLYWSPKTPTWPSPGR